MVTEKDIWAYLEEVSDPEIPVLTVVDLGVIRTVSLTDELCTIVITPTYSGCPAMKVIEEDIITLLKEKLEPDFKEKAKALALENYHKNKECK